MADLKRTADKENTGNRNISEKSFREQKMSDCLKKYSGENLLIQGWDSRRTKTLFRWLQELYDTELCRPVVVVTHDRVLAEEISKKLGGRNRPFLEVSRKQKNYNLFLGLPQVYIQKIIEDLARTNQSIHMDHWDESLFFAICDILSGNGYTTSIHNLINIFGRRNDMVSKLLMAAGYKNEAEKAASIEGNRILADMNGILKYLAGQWEPFLAPEIGVGSRGGYGQSLCNMVKTGRKEERAMPFLLFLIEDGFRQEILDCLKTELEAVTDYAPPVLVMDTVSLFQSREDTPFYTYIKTSGRLSLTISGEDCSALMKDENDVSMIVNKYRFRMILINGTQNIEMLTKHTLGVYSYRSIAETTGKMRTTFDLIAHDKNTGVTLQGDEKRLRLDGEHMRELDDSSCYISKDNDIDLYRNMNFDR